VLDRVLARVSVAILGDAITEQGVPVLGAVELHPRLELVAELDDGAAALARARAALLDRALVVRDGRKATLLVLVLSEAGVFPEPPAAINLAGPTAPIQSVLAAVGELLSSSKVESVSRCARNTPAGGRDAPTRASGRDRTPPHLPQTTTVWKATTLPKLYAIRA
jgi:hypothetical protein